MTFLYLEWQGAPTHRVLALKHARTSLQLARDFVTNYLIDALHNLVLAESRYGNPQYALGLAEEAQDTALKARTPLAAYYAAAAKGAALQALHRLDEAKLELTKAEEIAWQAHLGVFTQKTGLELDHLNNDIESARKRMNWFEERELMNRLLSFRLQQFQKFQGLNGETPDRAENRDVEMMQKSS